MTIEDILCETGGFGRFQVFVLLGVGLNRFTIGWSMLQMSYAGVVPDWFCAGTNDTQLLNGSSKAGLVNSGEHLPSGGGGDCQEFHFVGFSRTIINEWNLVCSLAWVKATVTSIQMAGVLLGALVAGQMGDSVGRKKTLYLFVLEHAALNFITAFSVSWQMFAACRFFIGLGIGGVLVSSLPYQLEFLPSKWRPLVSVIPIWALGVCVFAFASWQMENWSYLHIACGVLSLPGLFGYLYVPESLRWLTVHDEMKAAHDVVMKVALTNHMLQPRKASITLQAVAWEEQKAHKSSSQYAYMDLFRDRTSTTTTLIFCFHWMTLALVYYGISFSASRLAGTIHVNIFLLAVVEVPALLSTFYFDNKIGRKWTSIGSLAMTCAPLFACLIVEIHGSEKYKVAVITALCLVAKMGIGAAWAVGETWCSEVYPTVTRCLGLGTAQAAASLGAIIVPFLINLSDMAVVSFTVMGCLLLLDMILCTFAPETKDLELADTPPNVTVARELQEHADTVTCDPDDSPSVIGDEHSDRADKTVLEMVAEEVSDNEIDEQSASDESEAVVGDESSNMSKESSSTRTKEDTHRVVQELRVVVPQSDNGSPNPSPRGSPVPSLRTRRLDKIKSGDFFHGKYKPKSKDDSPPYIESTHNKNVRFSIY